MDTQVIHITPRTLKERKGAYESNKLAKRLRRLVGQAIADFDMICDGDKVMVCLSGGKDSYAMLDVLLHLQSRAPIAFSMTNFHSKTLNKTFPTISFVDKVMPVK